MRWIVEDVIAETLTAVDVIVLDAVVKNILQLSLTPEYAAGDASKQLLHPAYRFWVTRHKPSVRN